MRNKSTLTTERAAKLLQKKFANDFERIDWWLDIQNGGGPSGIDGEELNAISDLFDKIEWKPGADFGSKVAIWWLDGDPEVGLPHSTDRGYLTTVPGKEEDVDMVGIVHIPHTPGEKCDAGPVWMTLAELVINPLVEKVVIG